MAADLLDRCAGAVLLNGSIALRPTPEAIVCDVIDPLPNAHRCAEEFKVLVENASHALAGSKLSRWLPRRPLQWRVVDDDGLETVELWPFS